MAHAVRFGKSPYRSLAVSASGIETEMAGTGLHPGRTKASARCSLHASPVAARYNPQLASKYKAMIDAGKPAKLVLTALMRKIIELADGNQILLDQDGYSSGTPRSRLIEIKAAKLTAI
ncbi:MAG: hypothetical protein GY789_19705 [Hyphomicrobiales bacterium]|nr:hypothetical protein [Hyphomicrobiales bacterium]